MRRFGVLITTLYLVLNVLKLVSGCELPVNLNRPRYHAGLAESGGQIYYSGGVSSALTRLALSSVEVYDPQTNTIVNTFELPAARTKIFSTTAGSTVLFVGGTELFGNQQRSYNKVDIYDTNTRLLWTIDVPDLIVPDANVEVAGTKLFLTSRLNLDMVIIDISTNTTTKLPRPQNIQFIPIATASNGTHIFFLQNAVTNSMYIFEVATEQWIPFNVNIQIQTLSTIKMAMLGPRILVIIEPGRLTRIDMTFRVPRIRVLTFSNTRMSQTVVGDRLYILTRHSIIVYTANGDLVEYTLGNTFTNDPTYSLVHNNIVYVSATSSSTASGSRFDLNMLFQPVPVNWRVQSYSEPLFAQRGYVAYLADRKMSHVNLKTQRSGASEEHPDIVHHIYTKTVAVGNKWMITLEKVYCLFDFDTETWSIYPMPYQLRYHSPVVSGRYVLFSHALYDEVPLYDIELNQWSMIQLNSISNRKHIIGDRIVTMATPEGIGIYHIPSQQWTVALNDSYIFDEASATLGSKLIFAARPTNNLAQRLVCIFDIYTLENTCVDAPTAFFLTEGIRTVRNYVVFNNQRTVNRYTIHSFYALNVDTLEWRTFDLPAILQSYRQMEVSVHQNVVYVLRLGRIDAIDMSRMKQFAINAPVTQPISISAYGSKVVFLTGTAGESQTAVIYETSVRTWTTIDFNGRFTSERFLVTQNYIASFIHQGLNSMEFPTMMNTITDEERFIGQSIQFTVNAVGRGLTTAWTFADGRSPLSRQPSLLLSNLTEQNSGDYVVSITDTCQNVMRQTVNLQVHGAPSFAEQLTNSIMLCDQVTQFRVDVNGKLTKVDWELDNRLLEVTNRATVNVSMDKFALTCNSEHNFCAIASNPAGEARSCARVQLRSLNAVFNGPRPSSTHPTYFTDSEVDLVVDLLHEDCTEHVWLLNGREIGEQQSRSSALSIRISQLVTANEYKVRAFCGNSELESSVFTFDPARVSSLTPGGVAGIVIGAFALLVGAIVTGVLVQRRFKRSRQHEIELENLLNEAKSESYKPKDGVSIIHTTTWEWSPSDGYTYRPIDNFPCDIDTSLLKYSLKHAVDIDVWIQGDIVFSPKEKSSAKGKQEKLLNGLQIDMYVPQSPKYEIKVEPANFTLQSDKQVRVTVSSMMRMTAKSNICLIVVCEQQMIYSVLEFKIESKPSMWIDIEEIKMTGDFLGGGGFGAVTRGVYRGQDVAVKKLLLQHMLDDVLHEFEHEITLMKSLHHPNIVQFVGASNVHENLAIIIEYAPLGSLSSVMKKQKLSFSMKVTALFETAKALQFLHANGIIHRDIKPQNILVFSLEQRTPVHVKLTDFGTARFISENATNVTKNVGTFCYMAPESLGKNPRIDKSADVYSFAILMWEVLYELIPFEEFQWQSDLEKHVLEGKRLLLDPLPNDQLVRLIEECWHPDPSQRPSMTAVAQRLADL